uniref:Uncharacterized protein n=1 Tax=Parascaris equorum TaxID=6256 RepID=A0A914RHE6_PAREQ
MDETTTADNSQHRDSVSTARQKRLELLAQLAAKTQPKLGRMMSKEVDLATEEEKKSCADEWFERRFGHIATKTPQPTTELSLLEEQVMKGEITGVSARQKLQEAIMKSLAEKRRKEQEKRWQIYKADNFIEDQQQEEEEILSDPESELSGDGGVEDEGEEEVCRLEEEKGESKPKCVFLDDEAEESDEGTISSFDEQEEEEKGPRDDQPKDGKSENIKEEALKDVGKVMFGFSVHMSLMEDMFVFEEAKADYDTTEMPNKEETQDVLALCSGTFGPSASNETTWKICNNDKAAVVKDTFDSVSMNDVLGLCSGRLVDSDVVRPPQSDTARLEHGIAFCMTRGLVLLLQEQLLSLGFYMQAQNDAVTTLLTAVAFDEWLSCDRAPLTNDDDIELVTTKRRSRKIVLSESEDEEDLHGEDHQGKSGDLLSVCHLEKFVVQMEEGGILML